MTVRSGWMRWSQGAVLALAAMAGAVRMQAQATPASGQQAGAQKAPAQAKPAPAPPLQLRSLDPTSQADPLPKANPENFTADAPVLATVESYLHALLGWDANRIWRVEAIETTTVPGVSKVVAAVAERGAPANKVQTAVFYVLPDGKHLIANEAGPQPFGAAPYADNRALMMAKADGPSLGAAAKDLELVEFTDLQCPRCKDAEATMKRLEGDFPMAHVVVESFPLTELHPYAYEAASWGACVALASAPAYFAYAGALYATQADMTPDKIEDTLTAAVNKAGLDPTKVAECSKTKLAKDYVAASLRLGHEVDVQSTPMLIVNGRPLPLAGIPYESLKQIIVFQAQQDGVAGVTATPLLTVPSSSGVPAQTPPHP